MEFVLCWIMVSSDYMIRIEVALMDKSNQNGGSWLECHLPMRQCRKLGMAAPCAPATCAAVTFYSLR